MRLLFVMSIILLGCSKKDNTGPVANVPTSPTLDDCTFETKLVPGVPGSPGHLIPSERNPNGASELATHMRVMVADLQDARAKVLESKPLTPLRAKHAKLRCAWPTDPKDRNEAFDGLAQNYLRAVGALDDTPSDVRAAYGNVVRACRTCHEATCDGPIAVIDGLALEAK